MNLYRVVLSGYDNGDQQVVYVVANNKELAYQKILIDDNHKLAPIERKLKAITLIARTIKFHNDDVILYL